jgi:hypothetical protein
MLYHRYISALSVSKIGVVASGGSTLVKPLSKYTAYDKCSVPHYLAYSHNNNIGDNCVGAHYLPIHSI